MKKLLITASTFPRWEGDTEPRFILDYAKAMTHYYEVHVLVPMAPGAQKEEMMEGIIVHRYHYFPIHKWESLCYPGAIVPRIKEKKTRILLVPFLLFSLRLSLNKYSPKVDLVHAHWIIPQGIVQAFSKNIPYIVTGHGGDVTSLNFGPIKYLKKQSLRKAQNITVVSSALKEYINSFYPNNKTSVIPMGCDTSIFNPEKRIENYFGQKNKKAILFVGRLAEKKGVTYLIEAMKKVDDAILFIVGKGNLEKDLKEQAKDQGDKIVFLGPKTHKELPVIYSSADVFVVPSITAKDGDKEGFGLVILEAMASGVAVVASNSGGIPDIIEDGINGLLCEEKNSDEIAFCIKRIISDNHLSKSLITNGIRTAYNNSFDKVAERYYSLIEGK